MIIFESVLSCNQLQIYLRVFVPASQMMLMATWLANYCDDKRKLHDSQKTEMI